MQSPEQSSAYRVANDVQAAAFTNPLRRRLLIACAREERRLTELARLLDAPLAKLHYHAARLLDSGLLEVVRSVPRGGRPVRYYRAIAERFEVPYEFLPQLPAEDWSAGFRASLRREYERADIALLYAPDENGDLRVRPVRRDLAGPLHCFELWRPLRLDARQQMELGRDLAAVLERYCQLDAEAGAEDLLAHVAFAPRRGV
jgi:hypothetical protein